MMRQFRAIAEGYAQEWISRDDLLANSAAIDACYQSMRSGEWVPVKGHALAARAA